MRLRPMGLPMLTAHARALHAHSLEATDGINELHRHYFVVLLPHLHCGEHAEVILCIAARRQR